MGSLGGIVGGKWPGPSVDIATDMRREKLGRQELSALASAHSVQGVPSDRSASL